MSRVPFAGSRAKRDDLRQRMFAEQEGKCWICGQQMTLERTSEKVGAIPRRFATFDHITPKWKGGTAHRRNLKLACRQCNSSRKYSDGWKMQAQVYA